MKKLRYLTRLITFILINLGFIAQLKSGIIVPFLFCYGCPLASVGCPIGVLQNFIIRGRMPFYPCGVLILSGTLLGRSTCGLFCPFGAFQSILDSLNKKIKFRRWLKRRSKGFPIVILLGTLILTSVLGTVTFCKLCPAGTLFATIPWYFILRFNINYLFLLHIAMFVIVVFMTLFIGRFWCKYLCPLASMGVFNRISILTIEWDSDRCLRCMDCLRNCPMGISKLEDIGKSFDCILCGVCVDSCKNNCLRFKFNFKK